MYWIIETTKPDFEGSKLKQVINDMIEYYGSNDEDPDQINFIAGYAKIGREKVMSVKGIDLAQKLLDEGVYEWRKAVDEERQHQKELRADYYAGVL